jgi:hypothetical protein
MATLNQIDIVNKSGLDTSKYTVWVAGFMANATAGSQFQILQTDGSFAAAAPASNAPFVDVNSGLTIQVPNVTNSGNNRLVFTVTASGITPTAYPLNGYTAYPFPGVPGVAPAGPYDIFEFGPNAQYDVSAVDSFGINLSFTVAGDTLTYGVMPSVTRKQIAAAFTAFMKADPCGTAFSQLLYTSPVGPGYPPLIEGQFSAIVSPKDWLAIHPSAAGLKDYWQKTIDAFFTSGNQISFFLNGATVGTYSGSSDGTQYRLSGPNGLTVVIPKSDFAGNQPFIQAVRGPNQDESSSEYAAFGQIEAAIFEAFSRGVVLDGVVAAPQTISATYSSDAWSNTANWYSNHDNAYNNQPSVYDAYAKFFHTSTVKGTVGGPTSPTIFGMNSSGTFAMAYGFSLDEDPNVGSTSQNIPPGAWPSSLNVPAKTNSNVGSQTVTLTVGPWT